MTKIRSSDGRIMGKLGDYMSNEDTWYRDKKEKDLLFPRHNENLNGKVVTYHISELHKQK